MVTNTQSHWWWFDSHNSPKCSPWLESTLANLNDKTKTMLKLVEDDADSFAQRAEMYYKKRPELVSMVEDFYRAHRSLAERYDQLRTDRCVRVRSPLGNSLSLPKDGSENGFYSISSVKSFDSFSEVAYTSEDAAESEVDDPEEAVSQTGLGEGKNEQLLSGWVSLDECTQLREELNRLREENEIQKKQIMLKDQEYKEISLQLSTNDSVLKRMREELEAIKKDNSFTDIKQTMDDVLTDEVNVVKHATQMKKMEEEESEYTMQFAKEIETVVKLMNEVEILRLQNIYQEEKVKQNEVELEAEKCELQSLESENRHLQDLLTVKQSQLEHEKKKGMVLTTQLEELKSELAKLKENFKFDIVKHAVVTELLKKTAAEFVQLKDKMKRKDEHFSSALVEKDEEKRAVIRQLSIAMELLREDNQFLKQTIMKDCPKKSPFKFFKSVQFRKIFSSRCPASVVPL